MLFVLHLTSCLDLRRTPINTADRISSDLFAVWTQDYEKIRAPTSAPTHYYFYFFLFSAAVCALWGSFRGVPELVLR